MLTCWLDVSVTPEHSTEPPPPPLRKRTPTVTKPSKLNNKCRVSRQHEYHVQNLPTDLGQLTWYVTPSLYPCRLCPLSWPQRDKPQQTGLSWVNRGVSGYASLDDERCIGCWCAHKQQSNAGRICWLAVIALAAIIITGTIVFVVVVVVVVVRQSMCE